MKFTIPQETLLPVLQQCAAVADRKGTMPALSNVLIYANGAINLSATDLYQSVTADADGGKVERHGDIAVDARQLLDRVKVLTGEISFATDLNTLTLKSGSRRFKLQTIPAAEMPKLPDPDGAHEILKIDAADLASLIARVQFAISTDETRLHLNSLLLEQTGDTLTVAATDGHRLSIAELKRDESATFKILIPLKAVLQLRKLCEDEGEIKLKSNGHTLFAFTADYAWSCKLADAQYPPIRDVVPKSLDGHATIDRLSLLSALKAVSVAASDRTGGIKLSFGGDAVKLSSESPEGGESMDEIACEYSGPGGDVGVNARYLIEALGAIDGERVVVSHGGELDPMTIKAEGDESGSIAVCMPMRLGN